MYSKGVAGSCGAVYHVWQSRRDDQGTVAASRGRGVVEVTESAIGVIASFFFRLTKSGLGPSVAGTSGEERLERTRGS